MYTNIPGKSIEYISTHYGKFESLSKDECNRLILNARCGDTYSQNKIIESTLAYIIRSAQELWRPGSEIDDLVQVGVVGCIKAINTFDDTKGYAFITWAGAIIKNEMRMYLRQFMPNKRPQYLETIISVNSNYDSNITFGKCIEDYSVSYFEDDIIDKEILQDALYAITNIRDDRRMIIECYFGLNGRTATSQLELSKNLGVSQGYISRIISQCINDIRKSIQI